MRDFIKTEPGNGEHTLQNRKTSQYWNLLENIFIVILAFYPLRHISYGLDLWDTGYNYANFQYMGTEHMDPMWLFSTYLANAMGHLLTKLPVGNTLMGMNFYTGLFASVLALLGYFFCTRSLKMPKWIVFLGEMVALSLCWCPTALLYNYMTYVFFLLLCIFLYIGLVKEKRWFLFVAGIFLGLNVLVRFSNLPEAGMIVAVWAYDVILWLEHRKSEKQDEKYPFWKKIASHTGWCLGGFLATLAMLAVYIQIRYGLDAYFAGIQRLFGMTDTATDYKPTSMIMGMIESYVENLYWVVRIVVITIGGVAAFTASKWVQGRSRIMKTIWSVGGLLLTVAVYAYQFSHHKFIGMDFFLQVEGVILLLVLLVATLGWIEKCAYILWALVVVAMPAWLYANHFTSLLFYSYDSMLRPGVLFLMLTMFIAVVRIFHKNSPRQEKLISGMLILVILLTSLGSNNKVYPSLNNLFLAAPYTLWQSWRFICHAKTTEVSSWLTRKKIKMDLTINAFPVKCVLISFLLLSMFQFAAFGAKFVFAESTGIQDTSGIVENNEVLRGIKMPAEKAVWLTEISEYVNANELQGKEVILYGDIPSMSYYLQMPSAFNPWSDLRSYSTATMEQDLAEVASLIGQRENGKPVIILEAKYADCQETLEEFASAVLEVTPVENASDIGADREWLTLLEDEKWQSILEFMERFGYHQTFRNEKFAIYQSILCNGRW